MTPAAARHALEAKILLKVIEKAIAAGYAITLNDGEVDVLVHNRSTSELMDAAMSSDEDVITLFDGPRHLGWILFVYGNGGWDVISDHSGLLQDFLAPIAAWCDEQAEKEAA